MQKRILITGQNSFIGTSFENWCMRLNTDYQFTTIDMQEDNWRYFDMSAFDTVFHVAGIAHVSFDPKLKPLYERVNRDLTLETARKAKSDGVRQFIFMSSIIVYGDSSPIGISKIISRDTKPEPSNDYGRSKLQAEQGLLALQSDQFRVAIIRPPMVYGKGSKGNYPKLAKFAGSFPLFPDIRNQRSLIHIDNLCEFIRLTVDHEAAGIFYPQNREHASTSEIVRLIAEVRGKKIRLIRLFNPLLRLLGKRVHLISRTFGNLAYDLSLSDYYDYAYCIHDLADSIRATETAQSGN
ncbi:MAG TPA: NAD-dependent epimerase [Clostridiales bacterium]|nr:NAD-dependent epimerase [Clostridiales bacterium]